MQNTALNGTPVRLRHKALAIMPIERNGKKMETQNTTQLKEEYVIAAQAFDRNTGKPVGPTGKPREETINLKTNVLFQNVQTILDIKKAYERFWNELNDASEHIVFVSSVQEKEEQPSNDKRGYGDSLCRSLTEK